MNVLSKTILCGLILLSLTACGRHSILLPDEDLLKACPHPTIPASGDNATLAGLVKQYRSSLTSCNDDKEALRVWAQEAKSKN